ncbi:branched-chain amino acid ABC transporter permease [Streptococcus pneumoniae]|nr:branched-chain amino acid ABC transporter permease [Streptococcus pneumoniae]
MKENLKVNILWLLLLLAGYSLISVLVSVGVSSFLILSRSLIV